MEKKHYEYFVVQYMFKLLWLLPVWVTQYDSNGNWRLPKYNYAMVLVSRLKAQKKKKVKDKKYKETIIKKL